MPTELAVLDTDIWSHLFGIRRRPHRDLPRWKELIIGKTVVIATQSRAEVITGMLQHKWGADRRGRLLQQLDATPTVPIDEAVIQRYARLTADARARGDGLGGPAHTGDRWVSATALVLDAPLLAADRIYRHDPDLRLLDRGAHDG